MAKINPYQPYAVELLKVTEESPLIRTFTMVAPPNFRFLAGQFVEISVPGKGEAPFTPSSSPYETNYLEVSVAKVGGVTETLHSLQPGAILGLRGPFGKDYPLEKFTGKDILLVGGGVGLAPLRSLFLSLVHELKRFNKIRFCCGSRTPQDFIYKEHIFDLWQKIDPKVSLRITVDRCEDDCWKGDVGVVTKTLDNLDLEIKNSVAVVCGPPIMMKFTTFKLLELGYRPENIYLSMERMMVCGLGHCQHCGIGKYLVCKDGPVFAYQDIKDEPEIWA
ncbi:MAG: FAD/NAD(P)-binding protein [Candidatus Omnitrophota bacterium]